MNVGDVVKLASGGPDMTVSVVSGDTITCVWFVNSVLETGMFTDGTLTPVQGPVEEE